MATTLREVGTLIFVFGPLEEILRSDHPRPIILISTAAVGLAFIIVGALIEIIQPGD